MDTAFSTTVLRALRRVLRAIDLDVRKLAGAVGLTPSQVLVLREIQGQKEATPGLVASHLHFSQATVSEVTERLAAAGLLTRERSASDKRRILLKATPKGRALLEDAPNLLQERFRRRFDALPAWEQAMMLAALERLAHLMDAPDGQFAPLMDAGAIDRAAEEARGAAPVP